MSSAILGPFLVIALIALIVIYFIRRSHQKRIAATRIKQDPESYLMHDDLRATSAGDSTLKVQIILHGSNPFLSFSSAQKFVILRYYMINFFFKFYRSISNIQ